jgi:hypothetical protein
MGRGGYNGGSTIIGPWSSGWFSGHRRGAANREAQQHALADRITQEKAERKARLAVKAERKQKKLAAKLAAGAVVEKHHKKLDARPRTKKTPEQIAQRLNRAMQGVEVRRLTKRTLRLNRPKD